ncbi:tetratricopeptide repeat protein [Roseivirga sp.]|uniref:tetratricopeptide repeat protein n=1 Tax=Roseivirga sp. TaxID=1964215 RepID=UPI003B8B3466
MTKNTSSEETKSSNSEPNTIERFKSEAGPVGFIGAIIGVLILLGTSLYFYLDIQKQKKNATAQNEIFQAQYYYEKDSIDAGLLGDGRNLGFIDIIDIYSGTEVANLAHFYAGASYLKKREYQSAIDYLKKFSTSEEIVMARAEKLLGDAYMELGNFTDASKSYMKAAETVDDQFFSPTYLMKAALAFEKASDMKAAISAIDQILNKYEDAAEYNDARKHKARLDALAGN